MNQNESEPSQVELDAVYDHEGPSHTEILNYNFMDLKELATGNDERIKQWLRSYLNACGDSREKQ